jgi:hypothetical protein
VSLVKAKYTVRSASAPEAEREVLDLWRKRAIGSSQEVFRWGYLRSPVGPTHCFLLDATTEDGAAVVGMVAVGSRRIALPGGDVSAGLLGDFFVDKAHRTFFPALMLQRAVVTWAKATFDVVYGFPNASSATIMKKLGIRNLALLERHVLVLRHAPYIQPRVGSEAIARILAIPADCFRRIASPGISLGARRGLTFLRMHVIDERFDRLFRARAFADVAMGRRDAKLLSWRFLERPDESTTVYALTSGGEKGELRGYAVVHTDEDVAHVRDLLGVDLDSMAEVLRLVAGEARREGCVALSFLCSAPPRLLERLHALGFRVRSGDRTLVGCAGARLKGHDPGSLERWYLTEADEDQ